MCETDVVLNNNNDDNSNNNNSKVVFDSAQPALCTPQISPQISNAKVQFYVLYAITVFTYLYYYFIAACRISKAV